MPPTSPSGYPCVAIVHARLFVNDEDRGLKVFLAQLHNGREMDPGVISKSVTALQLLRMFTPFPEYWLQEAQHDQWNTASLISITYVFLRRLCSVASRSRKCLGRNFSTTCIESFREPSLWELLGFPPCALLHTLLPNIASGGMSWIPPPNWRDPSCPSAHSTPRLSQQSLSLSFSDLSRTTATIYL